MHLQCTQCGQWSRYPADVIAGAMCCTVCSQEFNPNDAAKNWEKARDRVETVTPKLSSEASDIELPINESAADIDLSNDLDADDLSETSDIASTALDNSAVSSPDFDPQLAKMVEELSANDLEDDADSSSEPQVPQNTELDNDLDFDSTVLEKPYSETNTATTDTAEDYSEEFLVADISSQPEPLAPFVAAVDGIDTTVINGSLEVSTSDNPWEDSVDKPLGALDSAAESVSTSHIESDGDGDDVDIDAEESQAEIERHIEVVSPISDPENNGRMNSPHSAEFNGDESRTVDASQYDTEFDDDSIYADYVEPKQARSIWAGLFLALLILVMLGQVAWWQRDRLLTFEPLRQTWQLACKSLNCRVPPVHAPKQISIERHSLKSANQSGSTAVLNAVLHNRAKYPVQWPDLRVVFNDALDDAQAAGYYTPEDYRPRIESATDDLPFAANDRIFIQLSLRLPPNSDPAGYHIELE